ncbi:MAG: biotin-dependent carboxyltransferase family protein, partial [Halieaceae bacterium]|nr:biotin-dependent carboxyltransferase family protein [Halieaceae bacterium]
MSMSVLQPGLLSLIQDQGRIGWQRIGLTNGGPLDPEAFFWCNRLLGNNANCSAIEVSFGGLQLAANVDTFICVTGATMPLHIDNLPHDLWQVHPIKAGQTIDLGFAGSGCRAYFGVADGFQITPQFGSSATVVREEIGGLGGDKLQPGDQLPCAEVGTRRRCRLASDAQPHYHRDIEVRVIPGYQQARFSRLQQRRFFSSSYTVSDRCDRMGYRLEGPAIHCEIEGILSEGICYGAIQVPADGQPIVLLNDRQTIGGYPKIGSALSLDAARLAQLTPGGSVHF